MGLNICPNTQYVKENSIAEPDYVQPCSASVFLFRVMLRRNHTQFKFVAIIYKIQKRKCTRMFFGNIVCVIYDGAVARDDFWFSCV